MLALSHIKDIFTDVESFENPIVNCSTWFSKNFTSTLVLSTSNFGSGCEIAKNTSLSELRETVHLSSYGNVKRAYFPAFNFSPLNKMSDEVSNVVAALAPVLQYFPKGTKAPSSSEPKISLSFCMDDYKPPQSLHYRSCNQQYP